MHTWQLQEAKSRFSELVDLTLSEGPQLVTRRGQDAVVILSAKDYRRMSGGAPPQQPLHSIKFLPFQVELTFCDGSSEVGFIGAFKTIFFGNLSHRYCEGFTKLRARRRDECPSPFFKFSGCFSPPCTSIPENDLEFGLCWRFHFN